MSFHSVAKETSDVWVFLYRTVKAPLRPPLHKAPFLTSLSPLSKISNDPLLYESTLIYIKFRKEQNISYPFSLHAGLDIVLGHDCVESMAFDS